MKMWRGGGGAGAGDRGPALLSFVCHGQEFGLYRTSTMESLKKSEHRIIFIL